MDNVRELVTLNRVELRGLINLLVEHNKRVDVVKTQFQQIYLRTISPHTINLVLIKHEQEINDLRKEWQDKPETQELFHLTERLKRWNVLYQLALKEDAVQMNVKYDKDTYDLIGKPDLKNAHAILKGAAWDVHMAHKLKIDEKKLGQLPGEDTERDEPEDRERKVVSW